MTNAVLAPSDDIPGTVPSAAEVAVLTRSGFVESRHTGHGVVTDPSGVPVFEVGAPDQATYARSTLKPWQALACLLADAPLDGAQLAIAAGSHTGTREHTRVVATMLADAGLTTDDLECPPDWPEDESARERSARTGDGPSAIAMNCSGKHAAMLMACVANGWDTSGYLDPDHPLQRHTREVIEDRAGARVAHIGVDGCGAPTFAMPLVALARAAGALAHDGGEDQRVADAMREHPWAVGGHGHQNTRVMELLPGVVCKGGAEGVLILGTRVGVGVAVKVIDGGSRATTLVALTLLAARGHDVDAAVAATVPPVLGGGRPVGAIHAGRDLPTPGAQA